MDKPPTLKKDWAVTPRAFDRLLAELDPDRGRAGEKYELVRRKLVKFFGWRGCAVSAAEEYADRTIDRVARRIDEGAEVHARDPYLYFHGTAVNVLREHWKRVEREGIEALDELSPSRNPSINPAEAEEAEAARAGREQRLDCLDKCAARLPSDQLALIAEYHRGEGRERIARRKEMAERQQLPLNALRIRMCRLRDELESCINGCVEQTGKM